MKAPSQLYALEGRTAEREYRREEIPVEFFVTPQWTSTSGFVVLYDQGADQQTRAQYMPISNDPVLPGQDSPVAPAAVFYDRNDQGAEKAASEIAYFLQQSIVPSRKSVP